MLKETGAQREPREIRAAYDDAGLWVYQAFGPEIADEALAIGTFGTAFSLDRMTWIKPSFGWMLYRSGYARKPGQERVLCIKLRHEGWKTILEGAMLSHFDPALGINETRWQRDLAASNARIQWDPDRSLRLDRLPRRAIQVGIEGNLVRRYVGDWIAGVEDVTALAHAIESAAAAKRALPAVPAEIVYPVDEDIRTRLAMT